MSAPAANSSEIKLRGGGVANGSGETRIEVADAAGGAGDPAAKGQAGVENGSGGVFAAVAAMDKRKLYAGLGLLPLLVSQPLLANASKDPVTGRYAYHSAVAVMSIEGLKLIIGSLFYVRAFGFSSPLAHSGYRNWEEFLRKSLYFSVPALVYALGNNLVFLGMENLDPAVYQLLNNLKILSTAVLSWIFLDRRLSLVQWTSLLVLTCGAAVTQLRTPCPEVLGAAPLTSEAQQQEKNAFFGVVVSILVTICSGVAGVWTEYVMKGRGAVKDQPIQLQNVQLYIYGMITHSAIVSYKAGDFIADNGMFFGFSFWAWMAVLNQVFLGFAVSFLMKYADNIVKVFINCVAMLIVAVLSAYLFGTEVNAQLLIAIVLVAASIVLYNAK
jgi:solute carrier family 35 (UDP-sugar transporter), member A1/2/3